MATTIKHRRGTASQWTIANSVLASGEIGCEVDTGKFKLGDGVSTWSELSYFEPGSTSGNVTFDPSTDGLTFMAGDTLPAPGETPPRTIFFLIPED